MRRLYESTRREDSSSLASTTTRSVGFGMELLPDDVIAQFMTQRPGVAESGIASDQCRIASNQLVDALEKEGCEARVVWLLDHRVPPPKPGIPSATTGRHAHAVVWLSDGRMVDVTRRQFDPEADLPTIYKTAGDAGQHWKYLVAGDQDDALAPIAIDLFSNLPRRDVQVSQSVAGMHSSEITCDEIDGGVVFIHGYESSVAIDSNWDLAEECFGGELEFFTDLSGTVVDQETVDDMAFEEISEFGLDLGVEAACVALSSAGCLTGASCRGHAGSHAWSNFPVIALIASPPRAALLESIAKQCRCGISPTDEGFLQVWAGSVAEILQFTQQLISRRDEFDRYDLPAALAEARASKE